MWKVFICDLINNLSLELIVFFSKVPILPNCTEEVDPPRKTINKLFNILLSNPGYMLRAYLTWLLGGLITGILKTFKNEADIMLNICSACFVDCITERGL